MFAVDDDRRVNLPFPAECAERFGPNVSACCVGDAQDSLLDLAAWREIMGASEWRRLLQRKARRDEAGFLREKHASAQAVGKRSSSGEVRRVFFGVASAPPAWSPQGRKGQQEAQAQRRKSICQDWRDSCADNKGKGQEREGEMKTKLTRDLLKSEAQRFAEQESGHHERSLFGVTDGKAVGTYFEHKFQAYLHKRHDYVEGSSAKGIDFPDLEIDMKVTSVKQPQSSCPFKSARQKIFGLGYSLLVFVYEKTDNNRAKTGNLNILHTIFVDKERTADFQTTTGIIGILKNSGNKDDLLAFMQERMLPVDEVEASAIADELLKAAPETGCLTISNALQWRLQYSRVIEKAGSVSGVVRVR